MYQAEASLKSDLHAGLNQARANDQRRWEKAFQEASEWLSETAGGEQAQAREQVEGWRAARTLQEQAAQGSVGAAQRKEKEDALQLRRVTDETTSMRRES